MPITMPIKKLLFTATAALVLVGSATHARAHCDTLEGPVIKDARKALESGDVTPVLKWVRPEHEREIRAVFSEALTVRAGGGPARGMADRFFFETLVRVHRAGEGAPYTGLRPYTEVSETVVRADVAIETGSPDELARTLVQSLESGLRERFARVTAARKQAAQSVEKGRAFVEAYVDFMHYAERLDQDLRGQGQGEAEAHEQPHRHE